MEKEGFTFGGRAGNSLFRKRGKMNENLIMKKIFVFLLFGVFLVLVFGERVEARAVTVSVINFIGRSGISGADVTIKEENTLIATKQTGSNGVTPAFSLTNGHTYSVAVSKDGYRPQSGMVMNVPSSGTSTWNFGPLELAKVCDDKDRENDAYGYPSNRQLTINSTACYGDNCNNDVCSTGFTRIIERYCDSANDDVPAGGVMDCPSTEPVCIQAACKDGRPVLFNVTRLDNGAPINGASVVSGTIFSETTGSTGLTPTRAVPEGSYTFTITATGFDTETKSVDISSTGNPVRKDVLFP